MMAFQTQGVHENWILLKKEERGVDYKGMYYNSYKQHM